MHTVPIGEQDFEAGAEWIDAEHSRVFALLDELDLRATPADSRPRRFYFGGRWIERPKVEVVDAHGSTLADALNSSTNDARERAYLEAVALSDEGIDSDQVDLVEWRKFSDNYASRGPESAEMSAFRFPSTTDLCERIAMRLKGDLCSNAELTAVENIGGVRLRFADGQVEEFDEVVLTLPPPCLESLDIDCQPFWAGLKMTPTCKVALLFEDVFWETKEWDGSFMSDLAVQQVWPCGKALVCYINGRASKALQESDDPVRTALDSIGEVFPHARTYFRSGIVVDWEADSFARGGFPYCPAGGVRKPVPSEGPIRFAGDWTARWFGFVEGALESAERVIQEIKNEHGLS
jgi:monoamine oxidase